jgi:tetratricopeptide (TPR) repeat protein
MNKTISNQNRWRDILRRQSLANADRWLALLETSDDPEVVINKDYDNLLRALETALEDSGTFDMAYRLVQALYPIAIDYADWDRWLVYLEKALAVSQELDYQNEQANLLVQIGDLVYRTGNLRRAEELYRDGIEKTRNLDDPARYASTLAKQGVLYDLQGKMSEGIALCEKALSIAESIGDKRIVALANLNLSLIFIRARNWTLALTTAEKAYAVYQELGNFKFANKALLNVVAIWAEQGKWEEVNEVSAKLMDSLLSSGDIRTLSQLKNNLGVVAFNQANYKVAEAVWQEALRLHSQIQEPTELAGLYNNLGMVYTTMGEWEAAQDMLAKAVVAYQELGNVYNWANSLDNLADLYEAQGNLASCRHVLTEAIAGLKVIDNTPHAQEALAIMRQRLDLLGAD